tara:strand:+ start:516 stop:1181 length:666 start_codon:yes stop_codon:yes gene_type:complete
MPNILAIETSGAVCSVGLLIKGNEFFFHDRDSTHHSENLLDIIEQLLSEADNTLHDLDAFAVSCGPGSFTGIRVASALSQGLAYSVNGLGIKVSSLEVLSEKINHKFQPPKVIVIEDAKMDQLYLGTFNYSSMNLTSSNEELVLSKNLDLNMYDRDTYFIGSGCLLLEDSLKNISTNIYPSEPHAQDLLRIALKKFNNFQTVSPEKILPNYLIDETYWSTK